MSITAHIYQEYAAGVYQFALGLCGDPAWADDLAAETFVRALVSAKPIRQETVKAYLYTITRNLYLQQLRKEKRLVYLGEELRIDGPSLEHLAEVRADVSRVLAALQELSPVDRMLLVLRVALVVIRSISV